MKKLLAPIGFFVITPVFLFFCMFYLSYLNTNARQSVLSANTEAYAAIPNYNAISATVESDDSKTEIVRQFFARYNSPLEENAHDIILASEQYGIDFKLLPAIAMQESTGCKKIPNDSHNCWGYGIYSEKVIKFDNYKDAIYQVAKTISEKYIQYGLDTPEEIQKKWTPSNDGSWSESVNHFLEQLQ